MQANCVTKQPTNQPIITNNTDLIGLHWCWSNYLYPCDICLLRDKFTYCCRLIGRGSSSKLLTYTRSWGTTCTRMYWSLPKKSGAKLFAFSKSVMFLTCALPHSWLLTADSLLHATLNSLTQKLHFVEYTLVPGLSHDLYLLFSINAFLNMHFPLGIFKKNHNLSKMKWLNIA